MIVFANSKINITLIQISVILEICLLFHMLTVC
jgi:hypothetical protein